MTIRNLTPHPVSVYRGDEVALTIQSEGVVRLAETVSDDGTWQEGDVQLPLHQVALGAIDSPHPSTGSLPDEEPGTLLIVSMAVCQAITDRDDLVYPYPQVRDDSGRIIGCRGFARVARA